jgi:hypothetical protein
MLPQPFRIQTTAVPHFALWPKAGSAPFGWRPAGKNETAPWTEAVRGGIVLVLTQRVHDTAVTPPGASCSDQRSLRYSCQGAPQRALRRRVLPYPPPAWQRAALSRVSSGLPGKMVKDAPRGHPTSAPADPPRRPVRRVCVCPRLTCRPDRAPSFGLDRYPEATNALGSRCAQPRPREPPPGKRGACATNARGEPPPFAPVPQWPVPSSHFSPSAPKAR